MAAAGHGVALLGQWHLLPRDDGTLGIVNAIGIAVTGIVGLVVGGLITMLVIEKSPMNRAAKIAALLCPLGFLIGLVFAAVIGLPSWLPMNMPYRSLLGILNYGYLGWFGALFLAKITDSVVPD